VITHTKNRSPLLGPRIPLLGSGHCSVCFSMPNGTGQRRCHERKPEQPHVAPAAHVIQNPGANPRSDESVCFAPAHYSRSQVPYMSSAERSAGLCSPLISY